MSNELIPFGQAKLPALAGLFDGISNLEKKAFEEKWPTLSVKGGKFHGVINGEPTTFIDEDGVPVSSLEVIIVGAPQYRGRVFYAAKFDPANPAPPDCSSMNGKAPSLDVQQPQNANCQTCQRAIKVRGEDGKERAPCQQIKYLAVVVRGQEDKIYRLRLPMTSLYDARTEGQPFMAFDQYCDFLRKNSVPHTCAVVTKMIFDGAAEFPKLLFKPVAHLSEEVIRDKMIPVVKSDLVKEMIEGSIEQIGDGSQPIAIAAPKPAPVAETPKAEPTPEPVAEAPKAEPTPEPVVAQPTQAEIEAQVKAEMEARIRAEVEAKMKAEMAAATQAEEKPKKTTKPKPVVVEDDAQLTEALSRLEW